MVGSAIIRKLITDSKINIITVPRSECDLTNQSAVLDFIQSTKIDEVYLAAAESVALKQTQKINIDFFMKFNDRIKHNKCMLYRGIKKLLS